MKTWYEINNKADKTEILIYDQIGSGFFTSGIEAKDLVREIGDIKSGQIDVRINSPGGSVFDGIAIYNALVRHPAQKTTYNDGLAASIASIIFLAGNKKIAAENAMLMIHNPFGMVMGDATEMRKMAAVLDQLKENLVLAYKKSTAMTDDELKAAMDNETWYTATDAKGLGFVDEITGQADSVAVARFDFQKLGYNKIPIGFLNLISSKKEILSGGKEQMEPKVEKEVTPVVSVSNNTTAADIVMLATQHGCADKAAKWLRAGLSIDQVSREILDATKSAPISQAAAEVVALSDKDQAQYSMTNAIRTAVAQQEGRGDSKGFEMDISAEIAKKLPTGYKSRGGFYMPLNLKSQGGFRNSALDTRTATRGVETIYDQPGDLIEMLRNSSVVTQLGARTLVGLTGPVPFAKQTGGLTLFWTGENPGADVTESNITFGVSTLSPKTCQATTAYSRQLLAMSSIDVEGMARSEFAQAHALGWDLAALHGKGTAGEPLGIYNLTGVNSKAMGGVPTFAKLVDQTTECALDNALLGNLGWATTPGMAGKMMQTLVASSAGSAFIWQGNQIAGSMVGYRAIASNQVSSTLVGGAEHGIIFGNWNDLIIGMWAAMELIVDIYAKKKQGLIEVTSFQMVDIMVRHAESFSVSTGATIS